MMQYNNNEHFCLFSFYFLIRGYKRSILYCNANRTIQFIDNETFEILKLLKSFSIHKVIKISEKEENNILNIVNEMIANKMGFICDKNEVNLFPSINCHWDFPSIISNAIIDINQFNKYDIKKVITELVALRCKTLQIRCFKNVTIEYLDEICKLTDENIVNRIELIFKMKSIDESKLFDLSNKHNKISSIIVYNCDENKIIQTAHNSLNSCNIFLIKQKISDCTSCGFNGPYYFNLDFNTYTESLKFNSCLNRKIAIDIDGFIRNCPSSSMDFGHVNTTSLIDAISLKGFKKVWRITKDKIEVCKECEFRYFCIDCRAYTIKNGYYGKPLKCKYNPYDATWDNEQ